MNQPFITAKQTTTKLFTYYKLYTVSLIHSYFIKTYGITICVLLTKANLFAYNAVNLARCTRILLCFALFWLHSHAKGAYRI